jgi:hypothetical protein
MDKRDTLLIEATAALRANSQVLMDVKSTLYDPVTGLCVRVQKLEDTQKFCREQRKQDATIEMKKQERSNDAWWKSTGTIVNVAMFIIALLALLKK